MNEEQTETTASPVEEPVVEETTAPSQEIDPVAAELERVETRKRSKLEKLEFTRRRVEEQIAEERKAEGLPEVELDKPVTFADLEARDNQKAVESALSMADGIESEAERKLVKHHLENTIKPSGNPAADFATARTLVNAVKTGQVLEEVARTTKPKTHVSGPSAPMNQKQDDELTPEEQSAMKGFGLTKEQVIAARPKE